MRATAGGVLLVLVLVGAPALSGAAPAQSSAVTAGDIQRLQNGVDDLDREISRLRGTADAQRLDQLQGELDDLRDEVVYLRVKLRREQTLSQNEYIDVRDRLDDLRTRVRGDQHGSATEPAVSSSDDRAGDQPRRTSGSKLIPVGQEIDVRLQDSLNSGTEPRSRIGSWPRPWSISRSTGGW